MSLAIKEKQCCEQIHYEPALFCRLQFRTVWQALSALNFLPGASLVL